MMPRTCATIAESYLELLKEEFHVSRWQTGCALTTPYYLPDNSRLSLSVAFPNPDEAIVSDLGETFDRLYLTGLNLSPTDWRVLSSADRFGVRIENGEISSTVPATEVSKAIHNVSHAILDISYLSYSRAHRSPADFERAVEKSIMDHQWTFERNYKVVGYSASHDFDFVIMERRPVLVEALTAREPSRANQAAKLSAFKVADSKRLEANAYFQYLCLLDDRDQERTRSITDTALRPLRGYFDRVMPLSEFQGIDRLILV